MKSVKIIIALFFTGLFFGIISFSVKAESSAIVEGTVIETSASEVMIGLYVDYNVSLSGNPGIAGFEIRLTYDASVLTPVNVGTEDSPKYATQGDFSSTHTMESSVPSIGRLNVIWYDLLNSTGNGSLFSVRFAVRSGAPLGTYPIHMTYVAKNTINEDGDRVPLAITDGAITIRALEPVFFGEVITGKRGETVEYSVSVKDNPGFAGCDLFLDYDKTAFQIVTKAGTTAPDFVLSTVAGGAVCLSKTTETGCEFLMYKTGNITEDGVLFTVSFIISDSAAFQEYPIAIRYNQENTLTENEEEVPYGTESGSVTVVPTGKLLGANVNITYDLKLQFFAKLDDPEESSLRVTRGDDTSVLTEKFFISDSVGYRFIYRIDPSMMADDLLVELMVGEQITDFIENYSVKKYADNQAGRYASNLKLMHLLADLLEYGAAVQRFNHYREDYLPNVFDWIAVYKTDFSEVETDVSITGTGEENTAILGASLDLTDVINVYFVVTAGNDAELHAVLYRTSGQTTTEVDDYMLQSGTNYVRTDELFAYEYNDCYILSLQSGDREIMRVTYSVKSYVASKQNNTTQAGLADLVKRLWRYGESVRQMWEN